MKNHRLFAALMIGLLGLALFLNSLDASAQATRVQSVPSEIKESLAPAPLPSPLSASGGLWRSLGAILIKKKIADSAHSAFNLRAEVR